MKVLIAVRPWPKVLTCSLRWALMIAFLRAGGPRSAGAAHLPRSMISSLLRFPFFGSAEAGRARMAGPNETELAGGNRLAVCDLFVIILVFIYLEPYRSTNCK
jgi:hypothetical protein